MIGLMVAVCCSCTSKPTKAAARQRESPSIVVLKQEPTWPTVEAAARQEVLRLEGAHSEWSKAYCAPMAHSKETWAVVVSLKYPDYREAAHYNLVVSDSGAIGATTPMAGHKEK